MRIIAPKLRINYHELGACYTITDSNFIYLPIPKNSSTYTFRFLKEIGILGDEINYKKSDVKSLTKIVILRNPLERWISGCCEYTKLHLDEFQPLSNELIKFMISQGSLDSHTLPQTFYLDDIEKNECIFLWLDDEYEKSLRKLVTEQIKKPINFWNKTMNPVLYNKTTKFQVKIKTYYKIKKFLEENTNYKDRLLEYLKSDYELINSIKFYEKLNENFKNNS